MTGPVSRGFEAPLLAGALSGFALADVLQLLELGRRSGRLLVDGGPLGGGWVQLDDGFVVATATTSDRTDAGDHVGVVAALLELEAGRWAFHADEGGDMDVATTCVNQRAGVRVSALLVDAARRRDERVQPGARCDHDDVPQLVLDGADDAISPADADPAVRLTTFELAVLTAVDGVRDVRAVAALLRREVSGVADAVTRLRQLGVVSPRPTLARQDAVA